MVAVFVASFINTGILILLNNANFEYYKLLSFIPIKNTYSDLDFSWYLNVGTSIVETMFIQSIMPYIEFMISYIQKIVYRWIDSGFPCGKKSDYPKTKKQT